MTLNSWVFKDLLSGPNRVNTPLAQVWAGNCEISFDSVFFFLMSEILIPEIYTELYICH